MHFTYQSLKLSTAALHGTTTGNIVNLISSDTQKFDWVCTCKTANNSKTILHLLDVAILPCLLFY